MIKKAEKSAFHSALASSRMPAVLLIDTLAFYAPLAMAQGTPGASSSEAGTASSDTGSMLSRDDSKMVPDMAHANSAEIETGKVMLANSCSSVWAIQLDASKNGRALLVSHSIIALECFFRSSYQQPCAHDRV